MKTLKIGLLALTIALGIVLTGCDNAVLQDTVDQLTESNTAGFSRAPVGFDSQNNDRIRNHQFRNHQGENSYGRWHRDGERPRKDTQFTQDGRPMHRRSGEGAHIRSGDRENFNRYRDINKPRHHDGRPDSNRHNRKSM